MAHALDPDIVPSLVAMAEQAAGLPAPERGDWRALRHRAETMFEIWVGQAPPFADVERTDLEIEVGQGVTIPVRWYRKGAGSSAAVVYAHGGGMIAGTVEHFDYVVAEYVAATGVSFLSVGYRRAPEVRGDTPARDVLAALEWLRARSGEYGVDPARISLMGDSGGGGVAAGAAILARDAGVPLARQILIYPMIDDRTTEPQPALEGMTTWTADSNHTGWSALLGADHGTEVVPPSAAPARLQNFDGLAPAYIEVGDLDLFRNEDIDYARRLALAGVPIELHVHPGAPHGFDRIAPDASVTRRAFDDRCRVLRSL